MKIIGLLLLAGSIVCLALFILVPAPMPGPLSGILAVILFPLSLVYLFILPHFAAKTKKPAGPEPGADEAEITLHNEDPDDK